MQFESIVTRTFDIDYILFDLAFTVIWTVLLIRRGYIKPLLFGLLGILVNFIVDYGVWYSYLGIRTIEGLPNWMSPFAFFVYFSITYGMLQYSYVQVMFSTQPNNPENQKRERIKWSLFLFFGWLIISFLSVLIPINDARMTVTRIMTNQRIIEVVVVIAEYILLGVLALLNRFELDLRMISYIFLVGVFVHFSMEFTLLLSGLRGSSVFDLVFNSLLEFNLGAPLLYLMLFAIGPINKRLNSRPRSS